MSKETGIISRAMLSAAFDSKNVPEVIAKMKRLMDPEDVAQVIKQIEDEQKQGGKM